MDIKAGELETMTKLATTLETGPGNSIDHDYDISQDIVPHDIETEPGSNRVDVSISFNMLNPDVIPDHVEVTWRRLLDDGSNDLNVDAHGSFTTTSQQFLIESLEAGRDHKISIVAFAPDSENKNGSTLTFKYHTHGGPNVDVSGLRDIGIDPYNLTIGKSFLTLSNSAANAKKYFYQAYYRSFDGIITPNEDYIRQEYLEGDPSTTNPKLTPWYPQTDYSFGTSLYFDPTIENPNQGAGIGFFVDGNASKGYFLTLETTSYSGAKGRNAVRILKIGDSVDPKVLYDSQTTPYNTLDGIYGGSKYNIDIKVRIAGTAVYIKAYINGQKITAIDESKYSKAINSKSKPTVNTILKPTNKVALVSIIGTTIFDYAYGSNLDEAGTQYENSDYNINFYNGQFSNDLLSTSYGDLIYYSNNEPDETDRLKASVDEFGTTAREILKTDIKFDSRPSLPIWWSTGNNSTVSVLGSTTTNFKGSAFVLNNTSTTVPLADGSLNTFFVLGNTLADSGTLEYVTDELADYVAKEPVIFESKWLQNESDVKSLANWIKDEVINKGQLITLSVFGNPLLRLGDIVTINYPAQGFNGEERLIITSIRHSYDGGLSTSVTCRSINKTAKEAVDPPILVETLSNQTTPDPAVALVPPRMPNPEPQPGDGYFVVDNLPLPIRGGYVGTTGHVYEIRKPNELGPQDRVVVIAEVENRYYPLGSFVDYVSTIDLNGITKSLLKDNGNVPGEKTINLIMFCARGDTRGAYSYASLSWPYTDPTS